MKKLLTLEEVAQFAIAVYGIVLMKPDISVYLLVLAFFIPDLFAVGYFISSTVGGMMYNFSHHKAVALAVIFYGAGMNQPDVTLTGLLFYAHSSFDRVLGYGLKYLDSFSHTHLGYIGKEKTRNVNDYM